VIKLDISLNDEDQGEYALIFFIIVEMHKINLHKSLYSFTFSIISDEV